MQECAHDAALLEAETGHAELDWKLAPLPVQRHQLEPSIQRQALPASLETLQTAPKRLPISQRQDCFGDGAAHHFLSCPSKNPLRLPIPIKNGSLRIHGNERIVRRLNDEARS